MEPGRASNRRCAISTRKSSEEGLEQDFNSLQAQREACESYIKSQQGEGWRLVKTANDDGGLSGATMNRPSLQRLLSDIRERHIDVVVVYKVDRLTRSLADFAKMVEIFDAHKVSFVAVTQQFNTTASMGRLTLNVLLSFTQFEREVTGERIRDKIAASKRKGVWMGGFVPLGYHVRDRRIVIDEGEAGSSAIFSGATRSLSAYDYRLQERVLGGLKSSTRRLLERATEDKVDRRPPTEAPAARVTPGTVLIREWHGVSHRVTVLGDGVLLRGARYRSLSEVARKITGTRWSGPRFFGLSAPARRNSHGTR
jgi:DNA invertase Pin-like site-specific DNA recombinase